MTQVFVALGANLEDPKAQLDNALMALSSLAENQSLKVSPYYHSTPMGEVVQPDYINAVASFETKLTPLALLDALQHIENTQGRVRKERWGPRTLDLDLLLYGDAIIDEPRLKVPHYGMKERSFVLVPLAAIAPDLVLPCKTPLQSLISEKFLAELQLLGNDH
ncbi:2-amino-4-hydroxy-6-hydroxymethyldihydropteridine diphosphokinase [Shewanella oneidensis MR-1]|uniref:2-amino-4-hydroxy-6-hydroxymethyldihydropteridine pyrophosphokinase n=1 Tax=Shewanella oneidensis (strain ATCC 700550 / JCM 31522 / CIP 106686 / LMG 19005 / NCIMB 14063 / MR-1) TaxID=211586 RepID=Q8EIG8_SHEON|nr:2-amino-4-hydroxy-6-hydroxymethyldihydropteridine diphosphokinase [Shewanella oneidensis]AAN53947.1 2-amino-4-hydroxy-6-hydroxymethyldihydropteridine pyrophosphokinase FolK [Shewanella oneidensis MR-1]MDX5997230.1 2-amino-4-hydroxy-6-hydroxymethyldihydropteridine diphosphokinase [Shewanella oneidensis]MEE2027361.1 2-amino-4-hydroxy-6-hydroxymethyldihydropteridine pyrophosphokinase [Shewanella oneidensis]QKG95725.1 2-amino-4-hydroxy-6-hydroxymethyldihydropteridine diphosphokinase [Shewanella 